MRCNVGIDPFFLTDQHLVAEYREITMVYGNLKLNKFQIKNTIPSSFTLNEGHMNFFKDKLLYLVKRHKALIEEMRARGFQTNLSHPNIDYVPRTLKNDWTPSEDDSKIIKQRIIEKIKMKPTFYKWYGSPIFEKEYIKLFEDSKLFYV